MFVLAGWQNDDLPQFAEINDILIVNTVCFLLVRAYTTAGISRHVHSYIVVKTDDKYLLTLTELNGNPPTAAHFISNNIYITLRSHVMKI